MWELPQAARMVIVQMRQDHMPDIRAANSQPGELILQQVLIADHRRGHSEPPEFLLLPRRVAAIVRVQTGIQQYPAALGIEQIGTHGLAQDEASAAAPR